MQNRNLEKLIPITMKIIGEKKDTYDALNPKEKKKSLCPIVKTTNGYFASFGPSVLMAGLNQTITFYEDKRKGINIIILEAMKQMEWIGRDTSKLTDIVGENNSNLLLKNRILEVIVACKLTIRTFELEEE